MNLSLLVGIRNNLPYTKHFYRTTREIYPEAEIVFVSYDSTDGTHEWLDQLSDNNLKYFYSEENKTLSDTYNKCIALATKEYVAFLHNDMVLGKGFVENILKEISSDKVLFYQVIEPPIFADDPHSWKIVEDFGSDFETFEIDKFRLFTSAIEYKNCCPTEDLTFFLATAKSVLLNINGLDPVFNPMFCEDNDILFRLQLFGLKMYQSHSAIAYHFVSKTSRFSEEYVNKTRAIEEKSNRNFYRKWAFGINSTAKENRKYGLILKNANFDALQLLEPFVLKIYTSSANLDNYIKNEQLFTQFDLSKKFDPENAEKREDVLIFFDAKHLSKKNLEKFETLSEIIKKKTQSPWFNFKKRLFSNASFKTGDLKIKIRRLKTYEDSLIIRK